MGLFDGVFNLFGTALTNSANIGMANDANELQYRMFQQSQEYNTHEREMAELYNTSEREASQQFNLDMWNKQNAYNSPAAQAARLRAAGVNPYAVLNGQQGTAGQVQSSSPASVSPASSPAVPSPIVAQMQNPLNGFGGSVDDILNILERREDIKGKQIDNETRRAKNVKELDEAYERIERSINERGLNDVKRENLIEDWHRVRYAAQREKYLMHIDSVRAQKADEQINLELDNMRADYELKQLQTRAGYLSMQLNINADKRAQTELNALVMKINHECQLMQRQGFNYDADTLIKRLQQQGMKYDNLEKAIDAAYNQGRLDFGANNPNTQRGIDAFRFAVESLVAPLGSILKGLRF